MGATDDFHPLHQMVGFGASAERDKLRLVKTDENWQDAVVVVLCIVGVAGLIALIPLVRVAWRAIFKG